MRTASSFLSESSFWNIIDHSLKNSQNFEEQDDYLYAALEKLSIDELVAFRYYIVKFEVQAYSSNLWATAYLIKGGCSDDTFEYFRYWLISRGEKVFKQALVNPDTLCDELAKVDGENEYEYEGLAFIPNEVLDEKFEIEYYEIDGTYDFGDVYDYPEIELEWHEDAVKKLLPNIYKMINNKNQS